MSSRSDGLSWRSISIFSAIFLAGAGAYALYPLLIAQVGYPIPPGGSRWFDDLIRAIASNASMAAGVSILFEIFASRELIGAASREIASRVLGHHLPPGFDDRIREIVHETSIVLEDWTATFMIAEEDADRVRVTVDKRWCARNYSSRPVTYRTIYAEEAVYQPTFHVLEVVHNGKIVPCHIKPESRSPSEAIEVQGPKITLAARGEPGDSCSVHWQVRVIAPKRYSYILAFGKPTLNPRIYLLQSPSFSFFAAKADTSEATETTWNYHRAYLPGQHLRVWWKPTSIEAPA